MDLREIIASASTALFSSFLSLGAVEGHGRKNYNSKEEDKKEEHQGEDERNVIL